MRWRSLGYGLRLRRCVREWRCFGRYWIRGRRGVILGRWCGGRSGEGGGGVVALPAGGEMGVPGDNVGFEVQLITPIAMEKELRFAIREGGRTVGAGVISEIIEKSGPAGLK